MSFKIDFINEKSIEVEKGQTILQASLDAGIPHYHVCGGNAKCSTCRIIVSEGEENLSPQNKEEKTLRKKRNFPAQVRLACQTKVVKGDVKVQRIIKDETDFNIYIPGEDEGFIHGIGQEKELALFFLDIRNFTPFIEQHLPFDVIHIIRRLTKLFNDTVEANGGKIIELMGDGFYALFGLNNEIRVAVNSAVKAGYEIIEKLCELNRTYIKEYFDVVIEVGIGLHAGRVIIGERDAGGIRVLSAMGFPVNVASRLESATKELSNNFIISEYVYELLKDKSEPKEQKQIKLKGVSDPFSVRLMGKKFLYKEF